MGPIKIAYCSESVKGPANCQLSVFKTLLKSDFFQIVVEECIQLVICTSDMLKYILVQRITFKISINVLISVSKMLNIRYFTFGLVMSVLHTIKNGSLAPPAGHR